MPRFFRAPGARPFGAGAVVSRSDSPVTATRPLFAAMTAAVVATGALIVATGPLIVPTGPFIVATGPVIVAMGPPSVAMGEVLVETRAVITRRGAPIAAVRAPVAAVDAVLTKMGPPVGCKRPKSTAPGDGTYARTSTMPAPSRPLLALLLAAAGGCAIPELSVRPATTGAPAIIRRCDASIPACRKAGSPLYAVELPSASDVYWARLSRDAGLLVAAWSEADRERPRSVVGAFDLRLGQERWRVELGDSDRVDEAGALLLPSSVVVTVSQRDDLPASLVALDPRSGRLLWRRSATTLPPADGNRKGGAQAGGRTLSLRAISADEEHDFLVAVESEQIAVLAGANGRVLAALPLGGRIEPGAPAISWSADAAYVVDAGLTRIPRTSPERSWHRDFATHNVYFPNGTSPGGRPDAAEMIAINALGAATLAAFHFGVFVFPIGAPKAPPPEVDIGRTSEPVEAYGRTFIGNFGVLESFDASNGRFLWARRFPVTLFRSIGTPPASICPLAGGPFLHVGYGGMMVEQSAFRALYCLDPVTGDPLQPFESPLAANVAGARVSEDMAAQYDVAAEDRKLSESGRFYQDHNAALDALATIDSGLLVGLENEVLRIDVPGGETTGRTDLSDLGPVRRLTRVGDFVVAVLARGLACFDAKTGEYRWRARLTISPLPPSDAAGRIVSTRTNLLEQEPLSVQTQQPASRAPWVAFDRDTLVVAARGGRLLGVALEDGATRWTLPPAERLTVDDALPGWLVAVRGSEIDVHASLQPAIASP